LGFQDGNPLGAQEVLTGSEDLEVDSPEDLGEEPSLLLTIAEEAEDARHTSDGLSATPVDLDEAPVESKTSSGDGAALLSKLASSEEKPDQGAGVLSKSSDDLVDFLSKGGSAAFDVPDLGRGFSEDGSFTGSLSPPAPDTPNMGNREPLQSSNYATQGLTTITMESVSQVNSPFAPSLC
jgi:hypothetical protein